MINTHNGVKEKGIPRVNIEDYPAIKAHLDTYYSQLAKRADKGDTPYNLRNCVYMDDFSKPKIVWKRIGSLLRFCYDTEGTVCLDSTCFATGKDVAFLTAILNSIVGNYLFSYSPKTGTGDLIVSVQAFDPVKVPKLSEKEQTPFIELLNSISTAIANGDDYSKFEHELDDMVFDLYHFSEEERKHIEEIVYKQFR